MEYFLTFSYTLLFILLIRKLSFFKTDGLSFRTLSIIFVLKIFAGIILSFIYTYYYTDRSTADIFKYFDDSKIMYDALFHKPSDFFRMLFGIENNSTYFDKTYYTTMNNWYRVYDSNIYNESHTIIRFNALIRLFSFGYYNVHTVFICFLSLSGLTAIYKLVTMQLKNKNKELIFGIYLLPGVLLWGSGVMKEGLIFFGLGFLIYHFFKFINKPQLLSFIWIISCCILIYYTKLYILIIALPILIAHWWTSKTNYKYAFLKYISVSILFLLIGLHLHYIFPWINTLDVIATKQRDFIGLAKSMNSGSLIEIPIITDSIWSLIKNSPTAFINTLFHPFIFEANSIFSLFAALENLLIILLVLIVILFMKFKDINKSIFYSCLFAVIFMFTLTGLITTVMVAIVRYKVPALPFLMILLIQIFDKNIFIKKFSFLKFLNNEK